ncbi:exosomal polycystin-1-interacting protein-like isoform 2-T5 [Salvelinus alpinus]|uniref:exosomal polycystin-1-interacting protein-like n=1 Tax=Salvelinus alpinus TaxID=8036 RepID=UPI0039FCAC66
MSLNRAFSCRRPPALLPWLLWTLWVLLLPTTVASTTGPGNSTLLFNSAAHGNSLRKCSCSTHIQDCDEALANLLCSCRTMSHSELTPGGLREQGSLTMWLREPWVLTELLNGSVVPDLRLSYCGPGSLAIPTQYLALFGLRRLRVHIAAQGAPHPEQVLTIASGTEDIEGMGSLASTDPSSSILHVSFLDVALLNGLSSLKAYSVSAPPMPTLSKYFPYLPLYPSTALDQPLYPSTPLDQPPDPQQDCLFTFIY